MIVLNELNSLYLVAISKCFKSQCINKVHMIVLNELNSLYLVAISMF